MTSLSFSLYTCTDGSAENKTGAPSSGTHQHDISRRPSDIGLIWAQLTKKVKLIRMSLETNSAIEIRSNWLEMKVKLIIIVLTVGEPGEGNLNGTVAIFTDVPLRPST